MTFGQRHTAGWGFTHPRDTTTRMVCCLVATCYLFPARACAIHHQSNFQRTTTSQQNAVVGRPTNSKHDPSDDGVTAPANGGWWALRTTVPAAARVVTMTHCRDNSELGTCGCSRCGERVNVDGGGIATHRFVDNDESHLPNKAPMHGPLFLSTSLLFLRLVFSRLLL
jgi:hypothetical protein